MLALLLAAAALAAVGYIWQQQQSAANQVNEQQVALLGQIEERIKGFQASQSDISTQVSQLRGIMTQSEADFSNRIRAIRNELDAQEDAVRDQIRNSQGVFADQAKEFTSDFEEMATSIAALKMELQGGLDRWTLEEVAQLVNVANQQLQFAGDVGLAIAALSIAEYRTAALEDSSLDALRSALAADISSLENAETVDVIDVVTRLSALSRDIDGLALAGDSLGASGSSAGEAPDTEEASGDEASDASQDSSLESMAQSITDAGTGLLESLGDLIQIEKNGESVKPVVSAELRQWAYDRVRIGLDSAQLAFIRGDAGLYNNRLGEVRNWVAGYFDANSEATVQWLAELDALAAIQPGPPVPDVQNSLEAVQSAISMRTRAQ